MCSFELNSVVNACFMGKDYKDTVSSHANRQSHGFVFFKEADSIYTFQNGKSLHASSGSFLYLPKYSSYSFKPKYRGEVYCINLQCNDDVFGDVNPDDKAFVFTLKRTTEVESIYKKVIREMYLKKPYYYLNVNSLVYELASIIFNEKEAEYAPSSVKNKLLPAINYIDEHYIENDISIPFLASLCEMSENYFRRLFIKYYGTSPIKYINEKKMNYAYEFLKSGLYSVIETAALTGFSDVGYFSRLYKRIKGEMPSDTTKYYKERRIK